MRLAYVCLNFHRFGSCICVDMFESLKWHGVTNFKACFKVSIPKTLKSLQHTREVKAECS